MKKIITIITSIACVACLVGPGVANALTAEDLQTQITALLAQLSALQAQLGTLQGTTPTGTTVCTITSFTSNLAQGSTGDAAKCLQVVLNTAADTQVATTGAGSPGNETSYFGPLTKAAAVKFQVKYAADILTPLGLTAGTGFVGPSTRAKLNTLLAGGVVPTTPVTTLPEGCTSTTGYSPITGQSCATGIPITTTVAGTLSVALAADTPASATIIADTGDVAGSQALIPTLGLNFSTAVGTTAKVTTLVLKRIGVSSDSDTDNVYLYDGTTKLAEMNSLSLGVVTFTNADGLFTVSGNKVITVKFDLNKDSSSGKTIGLQVVAATNVTTDGAVVSGIFPISGNLMTTASVSDFGRLQVVKATTSASVDPGTTGFEAMKLTLTASNQNIKVYKIKLLMLGSANLTDLANLALYDGATLLTTVASISSDRTVIFDLSAAPLTVTSVKNLSLRVDVIGGSTRTISFSLQRATDVEAMDANYNVYVKADTGTIGSFTVQTSTECTVASGSIIVTKATDSPSGNIALGATNVTLAKYNLQAVGEAIKVSSIEYGITLAGGPTTIKNVRVYYDGTQVGVTDSSVTSSAQDAAGTEITVNFTVPVGTIKTLEIRADIDEASGNAMENADTIQAYLDEVSGNGQRVVSLGTVDVPSAYKAGNSLTVSASALTGAKNASVGTITVVQGATNQRIASFLLTSGASEGVDVSAIVFEDGKTNDTTDGTNSLGEAFNNLKLMSGGAQIAPIKVTSSSDAVTIQYTFYPSPAFSIAAGTTVQVDLYADVASNANDNWVDTEWVQLDSATGTGKVTSSAANIATADSKAGQILAVSTGGTLTVAVDATTPVPTQIKGGATDQVIAAFRFSANSVEDQTLTQLAVTNLNTTAGDANVRNIKLFVGGVQKGNTVPALDASAQAWFRNLSINIPKSGNTIVTVKADITPYAEGESVGNYIVFDIVTPAAAPTGATTDTIITKGATSGAYATPANTSTTYYGNAIYPYRTTLTAGLTTTKAATGNGRSANDTVAKLTLTGTSEDDAQLRAATTADTYTESLTPTGDFPGTWAANANGAMSLGTTTPIIGSKTITLTNDGSADATDGIKLTFTDTATDLTAYSKVGMWIRLNEALALTVTVDSAAGTDRTATLTTVSGEWQYVSVALNSTMTDVTLIKVVGTITASKVLDIDNLQFYNDSVNLDLAGNFEVNVPSGTAVYMKSGGTTYATGYYSGTATAGTVTLIPDSLISAGGSSTVYDLITSTVGLMLADTTANEILSISSDMGSIAMASGVPTVTAGDFRWYDQAVSAATPITWMNPSGGTTSVSIGY